MDVCHICGCHSPRVTTCSLTREALVAKEATTSSFPSTCRSFNAMRVTKAGSPRAKSAYASNQEENLLVPWRRKKVMGEDRNQLFLIFIWMQELVQKAFRDTSLRQVAAWLEMSSTHLSLLIRTRNNFMHSAVRLLGSSKNCTLMSFAPTTLTSLNVDKAIRRRDKLNKMYLFYNVINDSLYAHKDSFLAINMGHKHLWENLFLHHDEN